jgi:hypothetical protein
LRQSYPSSISNPINILIGILTGAGSFALLWLLAKLHINDYIRREQTGSTTGLPINPPSYFNSFWLINIAVAAGITSIVLMNQWASDSNTRKQLFYLGKISLLHYSLFTFYFQ